MKRSSRLGRDPTRTAIKKRAPAFDREQKQVETVRVSAADIMATPEFRRGVDDVRAGRPMPCNGLDGIKLMMPINAGHDSSDMNNPINRAWNYERGRQFGILAPRCLNVIMPRAKRLNPKALRLYQYMWDIL
jgi:hypothetical protein